MVEVFLISKTPASLKIYTAELVPDRGEIKTVN